MTTIAMASTALASDNSASSDRDHDRDDRHELPNPVYPGKGGQMGNQKGSIIVPKTEVGAVVEKAGQKAGQWGRGKSDQKGEIIKPATGN